MGWLRTEGGCNLFGNMSHAFVEISTRDDQFR